MEYERCSELEDHRILSFFSQADEALAMREMGSEDLFEDNEAANGYSIYTSHKTTFVCNIQFSRSIAL